MWGGVPDRWDPARDHDAANAIEIWSDSTYIATVDGRDYTAGSVTERWVTGVRSTMRLTVPPSAKWQRWLKLPALELLPFSGMRWGRSEHLVPLGVFPVVEPDMSDPPGPVGIAAQDHYQYVVSGSFMRPRQATVAFISQSAAWLMSELGIGAGRRHPITHEPIREPLIDVSIYRPTPPVIWQPDRKKIVEDLVTSIGAEAGINRYGQPFVRDRKGRPGRELKSGRGGTIMKVDRAVSWSDVANLIEVSSSQQGADFEPVTVGIGDPTHPAAVTRIGPRNVSIKSPLVADRDQAYAMANAELIRRSAPEFTWQVQCIPDATREAGDQGPVTTKRFGSVTASVLEVTHPLDRGNQTVRLGATL